MERTATSRSVVRACSTSRPISVDFPTPGGPVKPTMAACPVFGYTSRTSAHPSGSSFSTSEIARASARLSPASRRSARSAAVRPGPGTGAHFIGGLALNSKYADTSGDVARLGGRVGPGEVQVRRAAQAGLAHRRVAVVEVAVPADPPERGARVVLPGLGPAGEAGDVAPRAARARQDVHGEPERMLPERL